MAHEFSQFPPNGVQYSFLQPARSYRSFIRSPIKGFLRHYRTAEHHLIEAVLSPIFTHNQWIYSLENFQVALAFNLFGLPTPKTIRKKFIEGLFLKSNFKKLIFWSNAGKNTLFTYGGVTDQRLIDKVDVVYPAIRIIQDNMVRFNETSNLNILFSGDFFRKGGINVIDAFERAQKLYPNIKLRVCCDEIIDFQIKDTKLKNTYLTKVKNNNGIIFGRVARDELIQKILPNTDIYLLPTYVEGFGFAILEAMAYGIPVIATNHFAIPEMIQHNVNGLLIDTSKFNCDKIFKGYIVTTIPDDFKNYLTDSIFEYLCQLIESAKLRKQLGLNGLDIARTKFSFETRNSKMLDIYSSSIS